jgi:hypothetical protein
MLGRKKVKIQNVAYCTILTVLLVPNVRQTYLSLHCNTQSLVYHESRSQTALQQALTTVQ